MCLLSAVWRKHAVDGWKAELSATPHKKKILSMAVSRDGLKVATGDKKATIAVWSFDEESSSLSEHSATVFGSNERAMALVFSPDGRYLIFENDKGILAYADTEGDLEETIAVLAELPATVAVTALAFSPDDRWLAVGSGDGVTYLIDWNETSVNASKVVHSITSPMPTMSSLQVVAGLAWSSESMLIVAADVGTGVPFFPSTAAHVLVQINEKSRLFYFLFFISPRWQACHHWCRLNVADYS